jgi:hypothetical protein
MPSKFLTISALVLCCLFAGRSTRADSAKLQSPSPDFAASFTFSCGAGCGFRSEFFPGWTGFWEPERGRLDFADFLKKDSWERRDRRDFDWKTVPADSHPSVVSTPEPGSLLLTGAGLLGLAFLAIGFRRKVPVPLTADC